jgi:hypothetical protein
VPAIVLSSKSPIELAQGVPDEAFGDMRIDAVTEFFGPRSQVVNEVDHIGCAVCANGRSTGSKKAAVIRDV